jgi:hypothetical protein
MVLPWYEFELLVPFDVPAEPQAASPVTSRMAKIRVNVPFMDSLSPGRIASKSLP